MIFIPALYDWRDYCEIATISISIYYIALWLRRDKSANLLGYFYAYCGMLMLSYSLSLTSIVYMALLFTPGIFMVFALAHQETLQKNLIALKHQPTHVTAHKQWLAILLQTCLRAITHKKSVRCIIEHTDQLEPFIDAPYQIDAPLQAPLLETLLGNTVDDDGYIWVSTKAILKSTNVHFKPIQHAGWNLAAQPNTPRWQHDILLHTAHTDAVVFCLDASTHLFTLFAHGMIIEHISPHQAAQVITHHINQSSNHKKSNQPPKSGEAHAQTSAKNTHTQRTP